MRLLVGNFPTNSARIRARRRIAGIIQRGPEARAACQLTAGFIIQPGITGRISDGAIRNTTVRANGQAETCRTLLFITQ